jgi:ATP-dependent RNA helicase DeaD
MSQGSRDGVMISFKSGRLPILVATDVAARGLDIVSVTHIINFDVPTSPDVYVHRIGRTGRVGRSGRAITFIESRQRKDLEAIERHASTKISPWSEGATVDPTEVAERPRRHRKPHDADEANGVVYTKLIANTGRAGGLEPGELIAAVAAGGGLDGEAIRNVRVLERFALVEVPAEEADRIVAAVNGKTVHGRKLALEPVRGG